MEIGCQKHKTENTREITQERWHLEDEHWKDRRGGSVHHFTFSPFSFIFKEGTLDSNTLCDEE